ncbi:MAG: HEAT repeat domain-containing protein [Candidatus Berkelbacteria bacterium]
MKLCTFTFTKMMICIILTMSATSIFAGGQDLAWIGTKSHIQENYYAYRDGVFVIQMEEGKEPSPMLMEMGRGMFDLWVAGMRGYGVKIDAGRFFYAEETYTKSFPKGLKQIKEGDNAGSFMSPTGFVYVPGALYYTDKTKQEYALRKISEIEKILDNRLAEIELKYDEYQTFVAECKSKTKKDMMSEAYENKQWGALTVLLDDLYLNKAKNTINFNDYSDIVAKAIVCPSPLVRRSASYLSYQLDRDTKLKDAFIKGLDDPCATVRYNCVQALVHQKEKSVLKRVEAMAENDESKTVRGMCSFASRYIRKGKTF